ncbi:MAG TPA: hypothetical protein VK633_05345 [Verrucomicrobiae bacterium]|nr:hypothetical protein [Verrucomicrobiae bacterium]
MSAKLTQVDFESGDEFELFPRFGKEELADRFGTLKGELLDGLLNHTETISLHERFERAANEAAGLAWTTEYPLLVYPGLFEELSRRERLRESRQQQIKAQTETLMDCAV